MAFVAHHLSLGAARIWLHFDDPQSTAADATEGTPRVEVIRCDADYWDKLCGRRPDAHQNRQSRNIRRVCRKAALPWVAHIDNDEFLVPDRPIGEILDEMPDDRLMLRVAPYEALSDATLSDDIFTARFFRGALKGGELTEARMQVFGPYASIMTEGVLSHSAGKCFFRTGVRRLEPRIHGAFFARARLHGGPFHPDLALLHFHAQNFARWSARLPFRLEKGCYRTRPELQAYLSGCDTAELVTFHDLVQRAALEGLDLLRSLNMLRECDLGLRAKIATLLERSAP